jgi:hypothetical protein
MMKIFCSMRSGCFQVAEFLIKKSVPLALVRESALCQSKLYAIKIP